VLRSPLSDVPDEVANVSFRKGAIIVIIFILHKYKKKKNQNGI
jgi:hypothetical protein